MTVYSAASASSFWSLKELAKAVSSGGFPITYDPYFNSTVLLLNGDDASDAGQNNTFLDSSSNAHTITRNGNVTQGSFSPFSVDEGKWGNYFDGSGDYCTVPASTDFAMGTGDFTIEGWAYWNGFQNKGLFHIDSSHLSTSIGGIAVGSNLSPYEWRIYYGSTGANSSTSIIPYQWQHFAYVRNSGTTKLYVDGTEVYSVADTTNYTDQYLFFGGYYNTSYLFDGYLSNLRVVKGTAVYTSEFTPPTTALTAISGTSLLTCQSNRFVDNSSNARTITVNGDTKVVPFSPFPQTTAYDASTNGGSGYFDGVSDFLQINNDTSLDMGTGDFTVEMWLYSKNASIDTFYRRALRLRDDATSSIQIGHILNTDGRVSYYASSGLVVTSTTNILNAWHHVAVVRSSGTVSLYVDGVSEGTPVTDTNSKTASSPRIGSYSNDGRGDWDGYISNVRIIKGTAVYTADFTPPTAPVTDVSGTSLLCNFTNASIVDATGHNVLETVGNAQVDTTTVKYDTGAMEFDGTGDYLSIPDNDQFAFGSGDFTIEAWVYANSLSAYNAVIGQWPAGGGSTSNSFVLETVGSDIDFYWCSGTTVYSLSDIGAFPTGQWIHVAISRSGSNIYGFLNGVLEKTASISQTLNNPSSAITIGGNVANAGWWDGYIDDLRITKGLARYTANFTPPEKHWNK